MDECNEAGDSIRLSREADRMCSSCALKGKRRRITALYLNFTEAVYMCSEPECLFPLDVQKVDCVVVKRKPSSQYNGDNTKYKKRRQNMCDRISSSASSICHNFLEHHTSSPACVTTAGNFSIDRRSKLIENVILGDEQYSETNLHPVLLSKKSTKFETFEPFVKADNCSGTLPDLSLVLSSASDKECTVNCSLPLATTSAVLSNTMCIENLSLSGKLSHSTVSPMSPNPNTVGSSINVNLETSNTTQAFCHQTVEQPKLTGLLDLIHVNDVENIMDNHTKTEDSSTTVDHKTVVVEPNCEVPCKKPVDLSNALADRVFLHWANSDAMCWLDVAMAMIVHCNFIRKALSIAGEANHSSSIRRLIKDYDRAQADFRRCSKLNRCHYLCEQGKTVKLETSVGHITVKTGGGCGVHDSSTSDIVNLACRGGHVATIDVDDVSGILSDSDPSTTSVERVSREARRLDDQAKQILMDAREYIFKVMQKILLSQRGQNDSALLALSTLLSEDPFITEQLLVNYSFEMTCNKCDHVETNRVSKDVPTFMKLPEEFTMSQPCFLRRCFNCTQPDQLLRINFEQLPDSFFCHFALGVVHSDIQKYDFIANGRHYFVTGVVQYITKPCHFICHFRQLDGITSVLLDRTDKYCDRCQLDSEVPFSDLWMTYDDLKPSTACRFKRQVLTLPPSEVHIVLWESRPLSTAGNCIPVKLSLPIPASLSHIQSPSVVSCTDVEPGARRSSTFLESAASNLSNVSSAMTVGLSPAHAEMPSRNQFNSKESIGDISLGIDDRLRRSREKFLRDQNGLRGSVFGAVIPPDSFSVASVVEAARTKQVLSGVKMPKTGVQRTTTTTFVRNQLHLSTDKLRSSAPATVAKPQMPILSTPRARNVRNSPYESVLPLLQKKSGVSSERQSSVFSAYVPKGKQTTALAQNVTKKVAFAENSVNVPKQLQDDVRRSKVCFSLPANVLDSVVQQDNIPSSYVSKGITLCDQLMPWDSALLDGSQMDNIANDLLRDVPLTDSASLPAGYEALCSTQSSPVNECAMVNSGLVTVVPSLSSDVPQVLSSARQGVSSEVLDEWLCDEMYASDSFKSSGLSPDSMFDDRSVAALVSSIISPTVDSSPCDILNVSSGFPKSDLLLSEPISQFTFDDMLSYLYN